MSLNIGSPLIVCILTIFVAETSLGLFFEPTMDSVNEVQSSKEGDGSIVAQPYGDWLQPPIGKSRETNRGREEMDDYNYYDKADYKYDEGNQTENQRFEEEWNKFYGMEISYIGRSDPSSRNEKEDIKRWISRRRYKRELRRPFNRTVGCNILPIPPYHSSGECHHNDEIAKCWVSCHRYYRYMDNAKQKMFFCLNGNWKPEKLPSCKPESSFIPCEEKYISGNNMNVSCVEDGETMKCTATCESNFKFHDEEATKVIICEGGGKGVNISPTKFPDCHSE